MTTKARLHWFWRGAIAAAVGGACVVVADILVDLWSLEAPRHLYEWLKRVGFPETIAWESGYFLLGLQPSLASLAAYGLLGYFRVPVLDGEPHCRRCDHILRGLSEPRCPECGETI